MLKNVCGCAKLSFGGLIVGILQTGYYCYTILGVFMLLEADQIYFPFVSFLVAVLTSFLVIFGTTIRNRYCLLPYLISEPILIIGFVLLGIVYLKWHSLPELIWLFPYFLVILFHVYFWMIVYSLFVEIRNKQRSRSKNNIRRGYTLSPMLKQQQQSNVLDDDYEQPLDCPEPEYMNMYTRPTQSNDLPENGYEQPLYFSEPTYEEIK